MKIFLGLNCSAILLAKAEAICIQSDELRMMPNNAMMEAVLSSRLRRFTGSVIVTAVANPHRFITLF
jgi:hypothetical protein